MSQQKIVRTVLLILSTLLAAAKYIDSAINGKEEKTNDNF